MSQIIELHKSPYFDIKRITEAEEPMIEDIIAKTGFAMEMLDTLMFRLIEASAYFEEHGEIIDDAPYETDGPCFELGDDMEMPKGIVAHTVEIMEWTIDGVMASILRLHQQRCDAQFIMPSSYATGELQALTLKSMHDLQHVMSGYKHMQGEYARLIDPKLTQMHDKLKLIR